MPDSFISTGGSLLDDDDAPLTPLPPYFHTKTARTHDGFAYEAAPPQLHEGGALREGGAPELLSPETLGLLAQYAAVGLLYGALPGTIYPLFANYLNAEPEVIVAARTLVSIPWSFKVFYGFLTDCFPIFGLRRRPYMVLGWAICLTMLVVLSCTELGDPYFLNNALRKKDPKDLTDAEKQFGLYPAAQQHGGKYIVLMMFASVGYLMADVAADAVVVEFAQREPEAVRGRTQTAIYTVRTVFMIVANLLMAFFLNGKQYGGEYDFTLSFQQIMLCLAVITAPIIPITWFTIREDHYDPPAFGTYLTEFWGVLQSRAVYQIIAYKFFGGLFENFTFVAQEQMQSKWAEVTPRNEKFSSILTLGVTAVGIVLTGRYGLHWNWRWITAVTMITMVTLDAICMFLVTWNVVRNQYFWLGIPIIEQLPYSVSFIVSTYVVVELAEMGHEGAIYGLLTTVSNLSDPFAKTISKNVNAPFDISADSIQSDTIDVRKDISITLFIMYGMKLLSLAWLPLLPPQKKATQLLKAHGGKSRSMGLFTVLYIGFAMVWSVSTNLMSMFPATSCLVIAGGIGCEKKNSSADSTVDA